MKTYEAKYDPLKNKGVYGISLVENPAMEGLFIALSKDEEVIQLKTIDEEKRIIVGLVLEPNKNIYRNQNGEEFNMFFSEQTVEDLCYGFTKNQNNSNSTIEHDVSRKIKDITFYENWIVRDEKMDTSLTFGLTPKKGSWMTVGKVDTDEAWNDYVKTGKVKGLSIDAMLSLEEVNLKLTNDMNTNLLEKILLALTPSKKIELGSAMLADGSLKIEWEGDTLSEGLSVWVTAEDGTKVAVPVGEHPLEDGTILVVEVEGIVKEIKQAEAPKEEEPAPAQDMSNESKMVEEVSNAIKSVLIKYNEQEAKIVELEKQIIELGKQPSERPLKNTVVNLDPSKMSNFEKLKFNRQN